MTTETRDETVMKDFLQMLEEPETSAFQLVVEGDAKGTSALPKLNATLLRTATHLFRQIENLSRIYQSLDSSNDAVITGLSGLDELFTGSGDGSGSMADAETLWGQVDLQNQALQGLLKSSTKKLSKAAQKKSGPKHIRLLEDLDSDDYGDDSDSAAPNHTDRDDNASKNGKADDDPDSEGDDEETRKIKNRMKRAMEDMSEQEGEDPGEENDDMGISTTKNIVKKSSEEALDPAAEKLNNGFFDINEMEAFADEEEEYLPDSAYGKKDPEDGDVAIDKRSFHQKQRDGDFENVEEEDDDNQSDGDNEESEDAFLSNQVPLSRRKSYRADDEVDALYELYGQEPEGDEDDDVINMTAADFFGSPNAKYFHKWELQNKRRNQTSEKSNHGDDDSWNEYDFEVKGGGDGWNDDAEENGSQQSEESDKGLENINEGSEEKMQQHKKTTVVRRSKLEAQTEQLEEDLIAEKPWHMRGETASSDRPANSLLDSTPEFEVAHKMAPIITVEHTASIEDMIKKRVVEEDWDDVVPRELPDVGWHTKRGELPEVSQEKSKLSLGELYEREYLKKATGYDVDAAEKQSEEEKAKSEMKSLFASLCSKLDALSNYHFAPRPVEDEATVRPVTKPAIAMEEVLPLHVSDSRGVAPEEVYGKKHGRDSVLRADSELEQQDRKRLRSSKKAARRKARKQKEADERLVSRLQPGIGLNNPYEKRKIQEELAAARAHGTVTTGQEDTNKYGSSGTFFKRLQGEAQESVDANSPNVKQNSKSTVKIGRSASYKM